MELISIDDPWMANDSPSKVVESECLEVLVAALNRGHKKGFPGDPGKPF